MVTSNAIVQHCIIKVTDYTVSNPPNNGKKIICVTALTVIKNGAEVGSKLGNPVPLKSGAEQGQGGNNIPYDILFYIAFLSHFFHFFGPTIGQQVYRRAIPSENCAAIYCFANITCLLFVDPHDTRYYNDCFSSDGGQTAAAAPPAQSSTLKENNGGFYGNKPQSNAAQQMQRKPTPQGTPGTPGGGPLRIYPIASLTPYQNKYDFRSHFQSLDFRAFSFIN